MHSRDADLGFRHRMSQSTIHPVFTRVGKSFVSQDNLRLFGWLQMDEIIIAFENHGSLFQKEVAGSSIVGARCLLCATATSSFLSSNN